MTIELKRLHPDGIDAALKKAERYRLLNEAWEAECICRDVLAVDPNHQQALVDLLLCLTDQYESADRADPAAARALLPRLGSPYAQAYYEGIICERWAKRLLRRGTPGSGAAVYEWLQKAMAHFARAEGVKPAHDDSALLRWNTCARLIMTHPGIQPAAAEPAAPIQSE